MQKETEQKKRKQMEKFDMLGKHPGRALIFFAVPMILGNLLQQFYNMADSVIVGRFVGEDALAAVGASYSLTTVFIMIAIGGGVGASVIISQYLGAKEYTKMQTAISTALLTFLAIRVWTVCEQGDFVFVKDAGKHFGRCCVVSEYLFYGASIFIYVQRTFVNLQCAGKIKYPAVFVDVFYSTEHCVGSCGGNCIPEGSRGSGSGNRVCPGNCLGAFLLDPAPQTERI